MGLYGVLTQGVIRRTSEIGVRMALGAQRRAILLMVLRDAFVPLFIGLLLGIPAALGLARVIGSQLYGLEPTDPGSFTLAVAILLAVTIIASLLPARRASRVDPFAALRCE
jgi:ABC-type antimicrobial peptide transport system permease subunit